MLIRDINCKYGEKVIYEDFNINFDDNKINCIIGKSGCGKTTLLNNIAEILLKENRKISYVFQSDSLIPWRNIYNNLKIVIKKYLRGKELESEIDTILELVGLSEFKYYYPHELSGGMKQRVNLARALIGGPEIILMDEPFKSLDIKCKQNIIEIVRKINLEKKTTIILVTHDKEEILNLANSVFLLGERPVKILDKGNEKDIKNIIEKII
ncbi:MULTISPECIES: ATP-binding cassette domain-containing protein [unclassified Clostridium]|uniref:ABC transporter ATP-binding protein n=1 Tax=unclassified Clostridium TaxID=2614128 RepID=UPI001898F89E|nr:MULTISPECIES: ATP-binding cassette domain-containing protein [unclassified Clostridium]MBP3914392.1 ABC transporter ATP-binding protein [Clostridium sp.]MBQ9014358.1 ABC transporter ATP-binding protein [Bacilli bacterium]MEE0931755.1 ATP-binding cassette domain-containing protein [Clostridium sp.]